MRVILWTAPALAALALAGCAPTLTSELAASSGGPAPAPGYDWHLNEDGDEASLSYGMAETDDVPLDLSCRPGSGALQILQTVAEGHPRIIALESGGDTETYAAQAEPSAMHDGLDLTAVARTTDPVFLRFRKLGWLATYGPDYRTPLVAQRGSDKHIDRFFVLCG
ncbi:hypothetical protein [Brevundimonas sp.]|uniref:hypothetical protein n=1 Tax=Brevundimonas sp. TaxID=1871086 RepID=UPI0028A0077E|nr:hypothetical protein [Brevundimonas sp.]